MLSNTQWLNLAASNDLSPRQYKRLFLAIRNGMAESGESNELSGTAAQVIEKVLGDDQPAARVKAWLDWQSRPGNRLLCLADEDYPALLLEMDDPPRLLFCQGRLALLHEPQLAVVGTRHPSGAGREDAYLFAQALTAAGLTVTSGLAAGIDGSAHNGALDAGGNTIAVLGCGIDQVYPREHATLYHEIAERGLIVSEYPPGWGPRPYQFPVRNRIISALSLGVLVVEAGLDSGSLITARLALEQNREVFAIPGSIHNPVAKGSHRLLREGAKLVETVDDILEELDADLREALRIAALVPIDAAPFNSSLVVSDARTVASESLPTPLSETQQCLLSAVDWHPTGVEQIILRTGLASPIVVAGLTELCLLGLVSDAHGKYLRH